MGDRQFFADFYRMNASPVVFFFLPCLASFIITGLFLFLVYFIPSHFISVMHFLFLFFLSPFSSEFCQHYHTGTIPSRKVMFMFTLDLGGGWFGVYVFKRLRGRYFLFNGRF